MNIKNLYSFLFEDKLAVKTNDYIRKGIVEAFNLYVTITVKEDIEKLRQLITPATIEELISIFPLLKEQFVVKPYHNPKLADIKNKISDLYNKEMSKNVFWETISILHRDKKPFYWAGNVILYILTNKVLAPKEPIQFYPKNGYVKLEIQPEATCREHYRPSYKNQYTVLSDSASQYPFDIPKKLPRVYIERKELVREVIILELKCGYNAYDFNKQWKLVEPLQKDIIKRRKLIKSLRVKKPKEDKVLNKTSDISFKKKHINHFPFPDAILPFLNEYKVINSRKKPVISHLPKQFCNKMKQLGLMNDVTLDMLKKQLLYTYNNDKKIEENKMMKDVVRKRKDRLRPKKFKEVPILMP